MCLESIKEEAIDLDKPPPISSEEKPGWIAEKGSSSGSFLIHVQSQTNAKKLAFFLVMNVVFMIAEMSYGWWANSLGSKSYLMTR